MTSVVECLPSRQTQYCRLSTTLGFRRTRRDDSLSRISSQIANSSNCLGANSASSKTRRTVEVWTKGGLVTFYLLFVMELKTRCVHVAGCTPNPDATWMKQIARNLTECVDGFLNGRSYLPIDRDGTFCPMFKTILENEGVNPVPRPPKSPNLNAHLERFFGSLKSECLDRMIFFGERSLQNAVGQYSLHYHCERSHQSVHNSIITPTDEVGRSAGQVQSRQRIGGLFRYYHRSAA